MNTMRKSLFGIIVICLISALNLKAQDHLLKVRVIAPPSTPLNDTLILVGEDSKIGNWFYPSAPRMERENDSTWVYEGYFPNNSFVNFKITRGSYYKEAMYYNGDVAPQPFSLLKDTTLVIHPTNWNDLYNRSINGNIRYHHQFEDPHLKNTRDVVVWLPPSYEESLDKSYPVLYAHDGQNLMDQSTSYGREWRVDEIADSLMKAGKTEEFIIVAISNTKDRWVEYSGTPEGMDYLNFIVDNLKPFIDENYRTKADKANTAILGSSMGGLISFYMAWLHPDVFSKAAGLSSGFAFDDGNILKQVAESNKKFSGTRIYLDCGDQELDKHFLPANDEMDKLLVSKHPEIELKYEVFPGEFHNEQAWSKRLEIPLMFLFGK